MLKTLAPLALAFAPPACSTTPPPAPGVLATGPDTLTADELYPLITSAIDEGKGASMAFRILSGDDKGDTGHRVVEATDDNTCTVAWHVGDPENEPRHTNHLERDARGNLIVTKMPNRERDVVTRFDPPLIHARPETTRAEERSQDVKMLVADYEDPDDIDRRGSSTNTITYLGDATTTMNGETVTAMLVRTTLVSTFGPAKVNRTTDRWFVPDRGLVGESYTETVRVFGVVSEEREQEIWRDGVEPVSTDDEE